MPNASHTHGEPLRHPSIRACVFDMDGLMFDTERLYCEVGRIILARRGKQIGPELITAMMGLRAAESVEVMIRWHGLADSPEALVEESQEIFRQLVRDDLQAMPGLFRLLDDLEASGVPKAVATSSGRSDADELLGRFDLQERMAFVLSSEDVTHGKPHPEIYRSAAARFGVHPRQMLVLEDSAPGLRSAKSAGAVCVVIPHEHSRAQDFSLADAIAGRLDSPEVYRFLGEARCEPIEKT